MVDGKSFVGNDIEFDFLLGWVVEDVPCANLQLVRADGELFVRITHHSAVETVAYRFVIVVQHGLPVIVQNGHKVVSDAVTRGVDSVLVLQFDKQGRGGVDRSAVDKFFVIHKQLYFRTFIVRNAVGTHAANENVMVVARCFRIVAIGVIADFARSASVVDVFGQNEGKAEMPVPNRHIALEQDVFLDLEFKIIAGSIIL